MDVTSATQAAAGTSATQTAAAKASLDYDAFLKLLVAQMKNQDPTEPMDSTQYMAQLASFSNVEQAIQTNTKLDALLTASALNQADGVLGRTVTSPDGKVTGTVESLKITANGLVATLKRGEELTLGEGITIS
jgi:flagellar basal-body rod modification protein FlgD